MPMPVTTRTTRRGRRAVHPRRPPAAGRALAGRSTAVSCTTRSESVDRPGGAGRVHRPASPSASAAGVARNQARRRRRAGDSGRAVVHALALLVAGAADRLPGGRPAPRARRPPPIDHPSDRARDPVAQRSALAQQLLRRHGLAGTGPRPGREAGRDPGRQGRADSHPGDHNGVGERRRRGHPVAAPRRVPQRPRKRPRCDPAGPDRKPGRGQAHRRLGRASARALRHRTRCRRLARARHRPRGRFRRRRRGDDLHLRPGRGDGCRTRTRPDRRRFRRSPDPPAGRRGRDQPGRQRRAGRPRRGQRRSVHRDPRPSPGGRRHAAAGIGCGCRLDPSAGRRPGRWRPPRRPGPADCPRPPGRCSLRSGCGRPAGRAVGPAG